MEIYVNRHKRIFLFITYGIYACSVYKKERRIKKQYKIMIGEKVCRKRIDYRQKE